MSIHVAVIGESCADEYIFGVCDRICPEAAALCFTHNDNKKTHNVGMAGNTYNNIKSLSHNLNVELITTKNNIVKRRFVDQKYNSIIFREDINDKCDRICLKNYNFSIYDFIVFSDYCKGFLYDDDIINICNSKKKDCQIFIDSKKQLAKIAAYVDFIKINTKEFNNNITDFSIINSLCSLIVTMGEDGAKYYPKNNSIPIIFSTNKVQLRDVCGAGDTFLAALVVEYIRSNDIIKSIKYANECASKVVSQFGVVTL